MNTSRLQNQYHREDLTWAKVGSGQYIRSDGAMIRRTESRKFWYVYDADGEPVTNRHGRHVGGPTLTVTKIAIEFEEERA